MLKPHGGGGVIGAPGLGGAACVETFRPGQRGSEAYAKKKMYTFVHKLDLRTLAELQWVPLQAPGLTKNEFCSVVLASVIT